ncbi:hypothetical protein [Neobacillus mesonae]|uniref:hypothetical protein n=1 Tax=Neobacillus mesonae TaxID=1193713 RepID=UPI00082F08D0|nr:hypothetical protein [Neobacillus mesonae]
MDNLSEINIGYFMEQILTDVNTEENLSLDIILDKGWIIVECPWRIRKDKEIVLVETDCFRIEKIFT